MRHEKNLRNSFFQVDSLIHFPCLFSVSAMECFIDDRTKKPARKRKMSREKRILANRHERERVRKMNDAYEELRCTIPNYEETRVKTKLELLRIATNYIQSLKDHLQSVSQNGYNSRINTLVYPSKFDMENGALKPGSWMHDYPYPPQSSAQPPPLSQLPLCHFAPHQAVSIGSQFPLSLTSHPESSSQDFCSLFTSTVADSNAEESFLFSLQVGTSFRGIIPRLNIFIVGKLFEIFGLWQGVFEEDAYISSDCLTNNKKLLQPVQPIPYFVHKLNVKVN